MILRRILRFWPLFLRSLSSFPYTTCFHKNRNARQNFLGTFHKISFNAKCLHFYQENMHSNFCGKVLSGWDNFAIYHVLVVYVWPRPKQSQLSLHGARECAKRALHSSRIATYSLLLYMILSYVCTVYTSLIAAMQCVLTGRFWRNRVCVSCEAFINAIRTHQTTDVKPAQETALHR